MLSNVNLLNGQNSYVLSKEQIDKISTYSNVWGLVKYYHPSIKKNKYSFEKWNKIFSDNSKLLLFDISNKDFNVLIQTTILTPGEFSLQYKKDSLLNNNIFKWIKEDKYLTTNNKNLLYSLIINSIKIKHKQISNEILPNYNQQKYITQEKYSDKMYKEIALLGLIIYTQDIKYFYAYKNLLSKDVNELQKTYIPKTYLIKNKQEYKRLVLEVASNINDSHSKKLYPYEGKRLRIYLKIINDTVVVINNRTNINKVNKNDILLEIDDIPISDVIFNLKKYISASTKQAENIKLASILLNNKEGEELKLKFSDTTNSNYEVYANAFVNNLPYKSIIEVKKMYELYEDSSYYIKYENIGYINLTLLKDYQIKRMFKEFKNTDGLILDLRGYSTVNYHKLLKYISNKTGKYMSVYTFNKKAPGIHNYKYNSYLLKQGMRLSEKIRPFSLKKNTRIFLKYYKHKKIVVITNETAVSYSEQFLLAIKYCRPDAVMIGSPTNGTFGNNTLIKLPDNLFMSFTTTKIQTREGKRIQGIGVIPNIIYHENTRMFKNNKDDILLKALKILENE